MNLDILRNLTQPIFYVTNDVSRGIGLENILPNYHIVCLDDHPLVDILIGRGISVFCLERVLKTKNVIFRSTGAILSHPAVLAFIREKSGNSTSNVLFFKPQKRIELIAVQNDFNLIGNSVSLNRQFEDKISFFRLCQDEEIPVPEGEIIDLQKIIFTEFIRKYGGKFLLQLGRGWAGNSTFVIAEEKQLKILQDQFGHVQVKINIFIDGKTVLNNAVIFGGNVFVSEPALQIKANKNLTSTQTGTGGRQWPAGLNSGQKEKINKLTNQVADLMKARNYQGFFGLDFLVEDGTGEIFVIENNARLTFSVPFFTKLELKAGGFPLLGYHLLSFLPDGKTDLVNYVPRSVVGSEIVVRNTHKDPVEVSNKIKTGIYSQKFMFKKESYFLDSLQSGDFWLETAACGRVVNPEIEIARINNFDEVCDKNGNLKEEYETIINEIKNRLKLKNVEDF